MPYIDKNGKPVIFEEVYYANQYKKALIYYPVKAKTISGVPITPSVTPTNTATPTPSVTPTPTPSPPSFDPDAAAYLADVITSGGTTNATISGATETLFIDLKSAGLYSKINVMYPMIGGTAASHAINAKLNKSFDLTWSGGVTHSTTGSLGNGTNGYGEAGFVISSEIGNAVGQPLHMSIYTFGQNNSGIDIGAGSGSNNRALIASRLTNNYYVWMYSSSTGMSSGANIGSGMWVSSRRSTTDFELYKDGVSINTNTGTSTNTPPTNNLRILHDNFSSFYSDKEVRFATVGQSLTPTEQGTLSTIINDFQTTLGRNTY